jgi:hypothetical protein
MEESKKRMITNKQNLDMNSNTSPQQACLYNSKIGWFLFKWMTYHESLTIEYRPFNPAFETYIVRWNQPNMAIDLFTKFDKNRSHGIWRPDARHLWNALIEEGWKVTSLEDLEDLKCLQSLDEVWTAKECQPMDTIQHSEPYDIDP